MKLILCVLATLFALAAAERKHFAQDSLGFLVIGDWGGQDSSPFTTPAEVDCAHGMQTVGERINSKFVLALGDNFYSSGVHGDSHNARFTQTWENVYVGAALQTPWYVIAGNHDHLGNVSAQIEYTTLSNRWTFPDYYHVQTFSFGTGGVNKTVDIVLIDTVLLAGILDFDMNIPHNEEVAATQWEWIEKQLSGSKADYLFVGGHYPVYSVCEHGNSLVLETRLKPLLLKYKVNAYLSGHDHCLEHLKEDAHDLVYVLSGAAHECCYSDKNADKVPSGSLKWSLDGQHKPAGVDGGFTSITLDAAQMNIFYHAQNGTILYTAATVKPRNA